jgi:hypothetical protein
MALKRLNHQRLGLEIPLSQSDLGFLLAALNHFERGLVIV